MKYSILVLLTVLSGISPGCGRHTTEMELGIPKNKDDNDRATFVLADNRLAGGIMVADVKIWGKSGRFLVDTGAAVSLIDVDFANSCGIKPLRNLKTSLSFGLKDDHEAEVYLDVPFFIQDQEVDVKFLYGTSVLSSSSFLQSLGCVGVLSWKDVASTYWLIPSRKVIVPFVDSIANVSRIPANYEGGRIVVSAEIGKRRRRCRLVVDSGSAVDLYLYGKLASNLTENEGILIAGEKINLWSGSDFRASTLNGVELLIEGRTASVRTAVSVPFEFPMASLYDTKVDGGIALQCLGENSAFRLVPDEGVIEVLPLSGLFPVKGLE